MTTKLHFRLLAGCVAVGGLLSTTYCVADQPSSKPSVVSKKTPSPAEVLAKVDSTLGSQNINFVARPDKDRAPGEDKTLSPYFYVAGGDSATERLPLKETSAQVNIAGVIAQVKVRQVFENNGQKPIEAVYVFPASTRAAVHGMRMKIGSRTIEAKIDKKQAAREQYEQAKREGKRASLLEQERPNVFTMNVANIMPRDRIEVELDYSELLIPEDATYEFVYPTVVGPRYGGGADQGKDQWISNPYLHAGEKEPYKFDIKLHVETGIALKELSSPSHKVDVAYISPSSADVKLGESGGGNRDFILHYRLAGDQVETGLLLYQGGKENFFIMMMEPPRRPTNAQIPPREYIFLLDVSGSMSGFPIETSKVLAKNLLGKLRPTDLFNIVTFAGGSYTLSPEGSMPATSANIQLATEVIDQQRGGGGTELMGGLEQAYRVPQTERGVSRSVIVITDGYVGVEAKAFKFIREHLGDTNLFAFGIGSSVNRGLIEGMARAGMGEPFVVLGPGNAQAQAEKLREYIQSPVLTSIHFKFNGFDAQEVAPIKMPDLMAQRPLVLFGKFSGSPTGQIEISGFSGGGAWKKSIAVSGQAAKAENAPLRYLWARKWVAMLDDELHLAPQSQELKDAITQLGLDYNLLTTFTSFVAIDSEVVNRGGHGDKVKQPLPMPQGVSDRAIPSEEGAVGGMTMQAAPAGMKMMASSPASVSRSKPAKGGSMETLSGSSYGAGAGGSVGYGRGAGGSGAGYGTVGTRAKDEKSAEASANMRMLIAGLQAAGLTDTAPLVRQIESSLQAAVKECGTAHATTVKLRLTVDATGKVVKVEVVKASEPKLGECLKAKLTGLSSATKAASSQAGTLELTIRFAAF